MLKIGDRVRVNPDASADVRWKGRSGIIRQFGKIGDQTYAEVQFDFSCPYIEKWIVEAVGSRDLTAFYIRDLILSE